MTDTVMSALRSRLAAFLGFSHDQARDLYEVFGYPRTMLPEHLFAMYRRNDLAARIIREFPAATWGEMPIVRDDKGSSWEPKDNKGNKNKDFSPFAKAARDLIVKKNVMHYMERADRLASIGRFGVLVLGFAGGEPFEKPLRPGKKELLYMTPYSELGVTVDKWCSDVNDPRFGMPEIYNVQAGQDDTTGLRPVPTKSIRVHYTRLIHVCENLDSNEVYGEPRLACIYNRLMDVEKVLGGAAECFWINANRGMQIDVDPEVAMDQADIDLIKDETTAIQHQLKRQMFTRGAKITVLGSDVADPAPMMDKLFQVISGAMNIPLRLLTGSERGKLASSADDDNWAQTINQRRNSFAAPMMLKVFLQKMIDTGNLPAAKGDFVVEWKRPDIGQVQRAAMALSMAQAIATYSNAPSAALIVPEQEFRSEALGFAPESEYESMIPDSATPEGQPVDPNDPNAKEQFDKSKRPIDKKSADKSVAANMAPKPLYVSREVLNRSAIISWAKEAGIPIDFPKELHVTIMYSRAPVDWMKAREAWGEDDNGTMMVHPGGPRALERFGNLIVLSFQNSYLQTRHDDLKLIGCSSDYSYQPHITLCDDTERKIDIDAIEPYKGAIALGIEDFTEIK